jgi:sodium-dependent phosphate cotransporter
MPEPSEPSRRPDDPETSQDIPSPARAALPVQDAQTTTVARLRQVPVWLRAVAICAVLYLFLSSIGLMGAGFKSMGRGFAEKLIQATSNPFVGLFVGVFTTSIVQSSSLTTSIVVGMVSVGTLTVRNAIPIVMGANIGTTVTCTIVSIGYIGRRDEFRRAFACGSMHDIFNVLCVILLFPLEMLGQAVFGTGWLEWLAGSVSGWFVKAEGVSFAGPVKMATRPLVEAFQAIAYAVAGEGLAGSWLQVGIAFAALFFALWAVTKLMKSLMLGRLEAVLDQTVGRNAVLGISTGILLTAVIQSSSITTSLLVPLAAAGVVRLERAFPITVGANIGTTVTALLASLGGSGGGLEIALVHLFFNLTGTIIFVPVLAMRRVPIRIAQWLADLTLKSRWYAIIYVVVLFFVIPAILIFVR